MMIGRGPKPMPKSHSVCRGLTLYPSAYNTNSSRIKGLGIRLLKLFT